MSPASQESRPKFEVCPVVGHNLLEITIWTIIQQFATYILTLPMKNSWKLKILWIGI